MTITTTRRLAALAAASAIALTGCSATPAPSPTPPPDAELTVCSTLANALRDEGETYSSSEPVAKAVQLVRAEVGGVEGTLNERLNALVRASIPYTPNKPRTRVANVVRYNAALDKVAKRCLALNEERGWMR